jgi:hypothetical protein
VARERLKNPILAVIRGGLRRSESADCSNFPVFAGSETRVMMRRSRNCLKIQGKMNLAAPLWWRMA